MYYINNEVLCKDDRKDQHLQAAYSQIIAGHIDLHEQQQSPFWSKDGGLRVNGLLCVDLFKNFMRKPRYECISGFNDGFFNF